MSNSSVRDSWEAQFGRRDPKIICIGLNYDDHAGESGMELPKAPLMFSKFANTLIGDGDAIVLPPNIGHVDAEAEALARKHPAAFPLIAATSAEKGTGIAELRAELAALAD